MITKQTTAHGGCGAGKCARNGSKMMSKLLNQVDQEAGQGLPAADPIHHKVCVRVTRVGSTKKKKKKTTPGKCAVNMQHATIAWRGGYWCQCLP